jgi:hypothetical protein
MIDTALTDVDKIAPERGSEDTISGHWLEQFRNLLETKPYVYRDAAGAWVGEFTGYLLLLKKQGLNLDIDNRQRQHFFDYAKRLSELSNRIRNVIVPMEQDTFTTVAVYPTSMQWVKPYWQFVGTNDDSAFVTFATYGEVLEQQLRLDQLSVPYNINEQVSFLLDKPTLEAANIVIAVLSERIAKGLPVERVDVKPLTDYDAGQWQELAFTIYVDLASQDANREWDSVLDDIKARTHRQGDETVINALSERIGIHFRWKVSNHV